MGKLLVDGHAAFWLAIWMLANLALVGIFDLVALFQHAPTPTVSAYIQDWSSRWPIVAFSAGMLCGHLWFPGGR